MDRGQGGRAAGRSGKRTAEVMVGLGKVVAPHGVRGDLRVVAYSGSLEALKGKENVFLRAAGGASRYRLRQIKPHKGAFIVALEGIEDRQEAKALAGAELALPEAELPPLEADEYYWFQLVGLEVVTTSGARLGRVAEILATGAADVLVVRRGAGSGGRGVAELLVPAAPEIVKSVALTEGRMVIELPEGLIPEGLTPEGLTDEGRPG